MNESEQVNSKQEFQASVIQPTRPVSSTIYSCCLQGSLCKYLGFWQGAFSLLLKGNICCKHTE